MMESAHSQFLQARLSLPDPKQVPSSHMQVEMLVSIFVTAGIAYLAHGLRMYSRISSGQIGLEDWLMTAATIISMAFMTEQYFYFRYCFVGIADSEVTFQNDADLEPGNFANWLGYLLYSPILGLVKSSTLILLLRIAGHIRKIRWSIHVVNIINICVTISMVFTTIFTNTPISGYWDLAQPQNTINHAASLLSLSFLAILIDFLVLAIPFWAFVKTQLPLSTKLGVILVFMAGGLVTAIGIMRFAVFAHQYLATPSSMRFTNTWWPICNAIETNLAIVAASLPALRPLLRKWFPKVFGDPRSQVLSSNTGPTSRNDGSLALRDLRYRRGSTHSGSNSTAKSQQEMFRSAGIRRTTDIEVTYFQNRALDSNNNSSKGRPQPWDSYPGMVV